MQEEIKAWNPKGGRPRKSEEELRNKLVKIKLTEAERKGLYQESEEQGWKHPLVYCRKKLLSKDSGPGHNPQELFKALNKLNPELNKVGNNINRIARYVNHLDKHGMVDQKFIAEYNGYFKKMTEVQQEYTKVLKVYLRVLSDK